MTLAEWTPNALKECLATSHTEDVLGDALALAKREGYWLEFGVATGQTLSKIMEASKKESINQPIVAGFDSFEGLPEAWENRFPRGKFKQDHIPNIPGAEIVVGLFDTTLVPWIESKDKPLSVSLIHVDCDLYAGAKFALSKLAPFIVSGTFIIFDELLHYQGFENHEWKALYECSVEEKLFDFEWVSHQEFTDATYAWPVAIRIK